jgi:hypothetical protein
MWKVVIVVAPPLVSLLLESRSSKGKGPLEPLTISMSFWSLPEGLAEKYPWEFTKTSYSLTASTSASGAFPGSLYALECM